MDMDLVGRCLVINRVRCVLSNPSSVNIYSQNSLQVRDYSRQRERDFQTFSDLSLKSLRGHGVKTSGLSNVCRQRRSRQIIKV
jgi:hypothetical protein